MSKLKIKHHPINSLKEKCIETFFLGKIFFNAIIFIILNHVVHFTLKY